nr:MULTISPECIES: hypothetical protein [unclassified Pseudoclavibacter]
MRSQLVELIEASTSGFVHATDDSIEQATLLESAQLIATNPLRLSLLRRHQTPLVRHNVDQRSERVHSGQVTIVAPGVLQK